MTNLGNIATLTKKILPIVSILIIVGVLLFLIYLRNKNLQPTLPLLNKPQIQTLPHQIQGFDASQLQAVAKPPKKMPIYSQGLPVNLLLEAENIAQKLNLSKVTVLEVQDKYKGLGKVYANEGGSLSVFSQTLSYEKVGAVPPKKSFDVEFLKKKALADLSLFNLKKGTSDNPSVSYAKIQQEGILTKVPQVDADLINFIFNYQLGAFALINSSQPVSISYDSTGNLFSLRYFPLPDVSVQNEYPIITVEEALNALKETQKPIIKIEPYTDLAASTPSINSINIKSANLSYFIDSRNQFLQPFWVFIGESKIFNTNVAITVATPAIDPTYFLESQRPKP